MNNNHLLLTIFVLFSFALKAQKNETIDVNSSFVIPQSSYTSIPENLNQQPKADDLIFDNGPHFNISGNPMFSRLELSLGLGIIGGRVSGDFRMADDFILINDAVISQIDFYAYQTDAPIDPPPINFVTLQIWDGDPSLSGSIIVWGNDTDNIFESSTWSNTYRDIEGSPGVTNRAIFLITILPEDLALSTGTYWLDWSCQGDFTFSGPWQPPVTELGILPSGNAMQSEFGVYSPWIDNVSNLAFPFQIYGDEMLGIDELSDLDISIFPNPAENIINIVNNSRIALTSFDIYNLKGQLMQTHDVSNTNAISISDLEEGLYLLRIFSKGSSVTKKMVKK